MAEIIWSKKLKAYIMAEIIWLKVLTSNLSPMTTAEGGNPSRWTGGMRRRLSYGEGCCNVHCKDHFVSMKFMVIKLKCNIVKVFEGRYQGYSCNDD